MTDNPSPADVARKLTKAQRDRIIAGDVLVTGDVHINALPPHGLNAHLVTMYSMMRDRLTPLGLAVREHLQESPK